MWARAGEDCVASTAEVEGRGAEPEEDTLSSVPHNKKRTDKECIQVAENVGVISKELVCEKSC